MEKTKYISFEGKRIPVYWLRGDYCALEKDLPEFYGVSRKYLTFIASINKSRFAPSDRFLLTQDEIQSVHNRRADLEEALMRKVYAYDLNGLITLAFRLRKSEVASKLGVWVIRTLSNKIDLFEFIDKFLNDAESREQD